MKSFEIDILEIKLLNYYHYNYYNYLGCQCFMGCQFYALETVMKFNYHHDQLFSFLFVNQLC